MALRRFGAVALAAMLFTGLAACGGDDSDDGDGVALEDSGDASNDDSDDDSSDSDESDESDESDDSDDASDAIEGAFSQGCGEFAAIFGALGGAIAGAFDQEAAEEFEGFIDDAPDEIQDDLETLRDAYAEYAEALEDAGVDFDDPDSFDPTDGDVLEALTAASELFNQEEVQEASENINAFIEDECQAS